MNTSSLYQRVLISFLFFCLLGIKNVQAEQPIPEFKSRVVDLTNTLTPTQKQLLEEQLKQLEKTKGSQLAVLIVPTTTPETIEQYAIRVVEKWQLGRKEVDDGVLLLIAKNDRKLRIEVGYGLEGVIPDAIAKRVISEIITPYFKVGDFYGGIVAGVHQLISLIEGEPLPPPKQHDDYREPGVQDLLFFLVFVLFFAPAFRSLFGRLIGSGVAGGIAGLLTWSITATLVASILAGVAIFFLALMFTSGGRSNFPGGRGGYYGGGFGGGWSGRGGWSGGGGFGGGGGGSFGGGGASGGW